MSDLFLEPEPDVKVPKVFKMLHSYLDTAYYGLISMVLISIGCVGVCAMFVVEVLIILPVFPFWCIGKLIEKRDKKNDT